MVTAKSRAEPANIGAFQVLDRNDHVRNAAINEMRGDVSIGQWNRDPNPQIFWLAHLKTHEIPLQFRADHSGRRFERQRLHWSGDTTRITRETARPISAHLRFSAVGVVIAHPKIRAV